MNRPMAHSSSSRNTQSSTCTHAENRAAQRDVRTLPRKCPFSNYFDKYLRVTGDIGVAQLLMSHVNLLVFVVETKAT